MPRSVRNFALLDQNGNFQELYYYSDKKGVVIVSQGTGCPIIRKSIPYLRELKERYASQGIEFFMLNANSQDDRASLLQEAADYQIDIPILKDDAQLMTESLGLTRTAEALLIDPRDWSVVYHGAINDQFGYGTQKTQPRQEYLASAIEALLGNKPIAVPQTAVKGCLINFEHKNDSPDYTGQVAPILTRSCVPCHSPGGAAPWSMDNYEKVKGGGPWSVRLSASGGCRPGMPILCMENSKTIFLYPQRTSGPWFIGLNKGLSEERGLILF